MCCDRAIYIGKFTYIVDCCPNIDSRLLPLKWLDSALAHYKGNQDMGILNMPFWWQEAVLLAQDEMNRVIRIKSKRQKTQAQFKSPGAASAGMNRSGGSVF